MDSKILSELTELKDNISKVKDIFKTDIARIGQEILEKVDLKTYKLTDEEKPVEKEIEEMLEFISYIVNELYSYD